MLSGAVFLGGCSDLVLLHPKGPVGHSERFVILVSIVLMLLVVIPVSVMTYLFAWRYRSGNKRAIYMPKWSHSGKIELMVWVIPIIIVTLLSILLWRTTFSLDPYKPIHTGAEPVHIQVVSLDWKWLFIYPKQGIATVNQLVLPAGVPVSFRVTSATVMTSFFIPELGSQIYAMAGMQTRLHLIAGEPGVYTGQNQQFSGRGYAEMTFKAIAVSKRKFEAWVKKAKQSTERLDMARYAKIAVPSSNYPVTTFSSVQPRLFETILDQFREPGRNHTGLVRGVIDSPRANIGGSGGK